MWQVALVQSLLYSCFAGLAQGIRRVAGSIGTIIVILLFCSLAQGIRRVAGSIGTIIGPLWPSGMMHNMYAMFGVMVAVNTFGMVSRMQSILMNAHV